jgi:hypothetical protein
MKLYNIFYKGDSNGNPPCYEATTDNFEKWLEENNSHREKDFQEDADNFEVEEISLYLYDETFESIVMSWWDSMPREMQIEIRKFYGE